MRESETHVYHLNTTKIISGPSLGRPWLPETMYSVSMTTCAVAGLNRYVSFSLVSKTLQQILWHKLHLLYNYLPYKFTTF